MTPRAKKLKKDHHSIATSETPDSSTATVDRGVSAGAAIHVLDTTWHAPDRSEPPAPVQRTPAPEKAPGQVSGPVLQRQWEIKQPWNNPTNDGGTFGRSIAQEDLTTITAAVEKVTAEAVTGRPRLVYLGIGVGNPADAWGNPTGQPQLDMGKQIRPDFLAEAEQRKFFVIAMNFNTGEGDPVQELSSSENGIHVHVNAHAPLLTTSELDKRAVALLKGLAAGPDDRLVVMNAVSNHQYQALTELVTGFKKRGSYLTSYGATGEQHALVPLNQRMAMTKKSGLATLGDIFPDYEDQ
ncbi:hypothetical protein [Saccharopolyspora phatthalungensis]|uniref:Uncharacterized protein n=1 Tax=Saccharopolyspora phatthalungensis TaxID=664693 RepID=A0A840Q8J1_9PSEU|nr:hypothetical protein [Saccharopolyspora phatthalungensis]MBB5157054.1 hypothetical protein [Saccharopolyspora phatthalungensis]